MSADALVKAKLAIDAAKLLAPSPDDTHRNPQYSELIAIADVLAQVAQAEALERIADVLAAWSTGASLRVLGR